MRVRSSYTLLSHIHTIWFYEKDGENQMGEAASANNLGDLDLGK